MSRVDHEKRRQADRAGLSSTSSAFMLAVRSDSIMTEDTTKRGETAFAEFRGKWIERALADTEISPGAFRTLVGLAHHFLNRKERKIWAAQDTIATKLNISLRTVQGHLAELIGRGLINATRKGRDRPNDYFPIVDDTQTSADHEASENACHTKAKTRKNASDDTQERVSKTRKDLRTNPLKEPLEEPLETDSPPHGGYPTSNIYKADVTFDGASRSDAHESAPGLRDDLVIPPASSPEERARILDELTLGTRSRLDAKRRIGDLLDRGRLTLRHAKEILDRIEDENEQTA